jgi:hypothetical protein
MFKYTFVALAAVALPRVSADHASDVAGAVIVLKDLPAPFASTFCSTYVSSIMATATAPVPGSGPPGGAAGVPYNSPAPTGPGIPYVTPAPAVGVSYGPGGVPYGPGGAPLATGTVTITTTVQPAGCGVITVSSTTSKTFITTSTITVAPTGPASYKLLSKRANWCPDADDTGLPCRRVQYDSPTLVKACIVFHNVAPPAQGGVYAAVTVTATVTGPSCGAYAAPTMQTLPIYPTSTTAAKPVTTAAAGGYGSYEDATGGRGVPAFDEEWYS